MKEIRITCWGHACFGVSCGGKSILFDPYQSGSVPGVELPADLTYDRVYCSHGHGDHNARERVKETSPDSDPFPIRFLTVPHDDANGAKRGMNRISIAEVGGAAVVAIAAGFNGEAVKYLKKAGVAIAKKGADIVKEVIIK